MSKRRKSDRDTNTTILERAVAKARNYPIAIGDIVGHDSTDLSGEVLNLFDNDGVDFAIIDFGHSGIRDLPVAELVDINLVQHFALAEKLHVPTDTDEFRRRLRAELHNARRHRKAAKA